MILVVAKFSTHNIHQAIKAAEYSLTWQPNFNDMKNAFFFHLLYRPHSLQRVKKTEKYLLSLPAHHQKLLSKYRDHLVEVKRCIENNDDIIKLIIKDVAHIFENVTPASSVNDSVSIIFY